MAWPGGDVEQVGLTPLSAGELSSSAVRLKSRRSLPRVRWATVGDDLTGRVQAGRDASRRPAAARIAATSASAFSAAWRAAAPSFTPAAELAKSDSSTATRAPSKGRPHGCPWKRAATRRSS